MTTEQGSPPFDDARSGEQPAREEAVNGASPPQTTATGAAFLAGGGEMDERTRAQAQAELDRVRQEALQEIEVLREENRERQELLRALFDNAMDAIVLTDPAGQGRVLAANPAACRMFGYSADEFVGLDRAAMFGLGEANLEGLLAQRKVTGRATSELRYRRKDGTEFIGELSTALFATGDGEQNAVSIIRDVTARKRVEKALGESEQKYRELVQYAPAGIYEIDFRTRRLVSVNEAMCEITGYSREELLAMDPFALLDEAGQALFQERMVRWLRGEELERSIEYRVRTREGRVIDALLNVTFTADEEGRPLGATVVAHDITVRKQAEEALRETERKYRELIRYAPAAIYEIDFHTRRFTTVNEAMSHMSGYSREELLAMDAFDITDEAGRALFQERIRQWLSGQEPKFNPEYRIKTKYGHPIDVILNATFTTDEHGQPIGATVVAYDITERKERERRIARYTAVLQGINRIFEQVMRAETEEALADTCLEVALEVTGSAIGFVGEIGADGLLHDMAISDMGWEQCRVTDQSGHRRPPGDFLLHGLYGWVLDKGQSLLTNDPPTHSASSGVPEGHPSLASFLGVPLTHEGRTIGMIAVANRPGGYGPAQQEDLEAMAPAVVEAQLRKRAEQGRREASERYELVLTGAQAGLWDWDLLRNKVVFSPQWKAMRGFAEDEIGDAEEEWSQGIHPQDVSRVMAAVQDHLEGRTPFFAEEYRVRRKDGSWMWIVDRGLAQRDAQGRAVRMAGSETDITARRQAEEALRESQARLAAILEQLPVGVGVLDREGRFVLSNSVMQGYVSSNAMPSHELEQGQAQGAAPTDQGAPGQWHAIDPEGRVVPPEQWPGARALRGETVSPGVEFVYTTADGRRRWTLVSAVPFRSADGAVAGAIAVAQDVTQRRQAEEALAESEQLLRTVLENSQDGITMLDLATGQYVFMSPAQVRMTGYSAEKVRGITAEEAYERIHPDDREVSIVQQQRIAAGLESEITVEYRWQVKSGEYRWFSDRRTLVRDEQGRPVALVGISEDVTARKQAEEALRRYAERLRFLHEVDEAILAARSAAEVAQAVVDRAPRLLPCRRASVVLYEPQAGEVSLLAAYHGSGHAEPGQIWQGAADVPWVQVLERLARGQEYMVADVQALPGDAPLVALLRDEGVRALVYEPILIDDQFIGALKLGLDVPGPLPGEQQEVIHELAVQLTIGLEQARLVEEVQRYAIEQEQLVQRRTAALRASEERFRTIFDEAAIGIALAEPDGMLVATNPALRQMLGYSEQDLVGIRFFDLLSGGSSDDVELPPEVLAGQYDDYAQELQYVRQDGETGEAIVTVSLLREEEDEPALLLALIEDITARKRAQEALIQTERLAIMGRMAASLAHEVNNPIQSVVGCLGLAMEVLAEGEDAGEYMTVAMDELERAARIVHRMRDLGRQEEGRKESVRVDALVEKVVVLTQKRAQNQHIQVVWEGGAGLPPVWMVQDQIQQVFLNLVLNAIDAMPQGGELRIRAARTEGPPGVQVSFADTGMGIAPEHVKHLFEAFQSSKQVGLGLGLFVSHNIVQAHQGWIDVQSELGKGTTFTVWLPAV